MILGLESAVKFNRRYLNYYNKKSNLTYANILNGFQNPLECFERTIFPYYLSCFSKENQSETLSRLLNGESLSREFKIVQRPGKTVNGMRFCPVCTKEDLKNYGTPYFHTIHQLGGFDVCPHHGVYLKDAKSDHYFIIKPSDIQYSKQAPSAEYKLTRNLLYFKDLNREVLDDLLFNGLRKHNIMDRGDNIKREGAFNLLEHFYGLKFLQEIGIESQETMKWISGFHNKESIMTPFQYLLILTALGVDFSLLNDTGDRVEKLRNENLKRDCRNIYCKARDLEPIYKDARTIYYRCPECDCIFTAKGRILQYGQMLYNKVRERYALTGLSLENISEEGRITKRAVSRIIKNQIDPLCIDHKTQIYREQAKGYRNKRELSQGNSGAYCHLKKYDSKWLDVHFPEKTLNLYPEAKMRDKDLDYVDFLKSTQEQWLKSKERLSKVFFSRYLGFYRYHSVKSNYPLTNAFILENIESWEEYQKRIKKL